MYKYLLSILISVLFTACTPPAPQVKQNSIRELSFLLQSLDQHIPFKEAERLSVDIFQQTEKLRKKFDPVSEPHFNNFLINTGLKEQGLCYEWSDALYTYFRKQHYLDFEFHLLVSNKGEYFFEHNVLVVVARNGKVMEGVIIDPWRAPGSLYYSTVKADVKYRWHHRAKRGCLRLKG